MPQTALKLDKKGNLRLTEADVTEQCIDELRADGWTCKRQHVGKFIPLSEKDKPDPRVVTIGEKGDTDWLVIKTRIRRWSDPQTYIFYLEFKAPGKQPRADQKLKHEALRRDGWLVCVAHGLDELRDWIEEYGL